MAEFYGTLQGSRGSASRLGSKSSGIVTTAQSWEGSVTVTIHGSSEGKTVEIQVAEGSNRGGRTLYRGSMAELLKLVAGPSVPVVIPGTTDEDWKRS